VEIEPWRTQMGFLLELLKEKQLLLLMGIAVPSTTAIVDDVTDAAVAPSSSSLP
ncbi:hypothetical protein Dimus_023343, partial [Dionaea muscipula]